MSSAAEGYAKFVGDGADVSSGADGHGEGGGAGVECGDFEGVDGDGSGLEVDGLAGAGELVGWRAGDLFCGEGRGHLLQLAVEARGGGADFGKREMRISLRTEGRAFGVVSVRGKAEADGPGVVFFGGGEVLCEAGVSAEQQREDARGHGIKRAEMADGFFAGDAAEAADDVVAGDAGGFIYDEKAVHWFTLAAE